MTEPLTVFEYLKQGGFLALAVLLGLLLRWAMKEMLEMHKANEARLEKDLENVKKQRDEARDKVLEEKERYHRLANETVTVLREAGRWFEYFARHAGNPEGRRGSGRVEAPSGNRPFVEEDEGGATTQRRRR